ncbi:hypothetical protein SDC9_154687 [bioreactor metagenome]|uniref:Uncharacterized protein n=1 Tax=bioreactor metagenome TaxID=1076179 RepID=A0A645EZQ3_9ZZZZ
MEGLGNGFIGNLQKVKNAVGKVIDTTKESFGNMDNGISAGITGINGISALPEQLNYAVSTESGGKSESEKAADMAGIISDAVSQALLAGLTAVGDSILDAIPKEIQMYMNGKFLTKAVWDDFDEEGRSRSRIYAPSREQIISIIRSVVQEG